MRRIAVLVTGLAMVLLSCGGGEIEATSTTVPDDGQPSKLQELATARSRWAAVGPADYTVAVSDHGGASQTIAVHAGEIVSLGGAEPITVEDTFETIDDALRLGAVVDVEYDPETGYPRRVVIDLDGDGVADVDLTFSDLESMPVVETLEELLAARARWEAARPDAYRYIMRADCSCDDGGTFDVEVRDNRVANYVALDEAARTSGLTPTTLDVAFDDLEEWFTDRGSLVDEGLLAVDVRMDPALGYPRWFHVVAESMDEEAFAGRFTLVVTIDLVLPYKPIEDPSEPPPSDDGASLAAAIERWQRAALADYRYVFTLVCECPLAESGPFEVTVRNGAVANIVHLGDLEGARPDKVLIDELFETIQVFVDAGIDVDVTYHPVLGYPQKAILDPEAVAVDGGMFFTVGELGPLGGQGMIAGRAVAGPQCPVEQFPPLPECAYQPVPEAVILLSHAQWNGPRQARVAPDGTFIFAELEPGRYVITTLALEGFFGVPQPIELDVVAGTVHDVEVSFDTGIR